MKLKNLFKTCEDVLIYGSDELEITGISATSKKIASGYLFIAKKGHTHDGMAYCYEAIDRDAKAILLDRFNSSLPASVVQIIHPNCAAIEAQLAAIYYGFPSQHLFMVGITGTNGKTTTSFIIRELIEQLIGSCGLIGTIEYIAGSKKYPATHTTPDVIFNQHLLREMIEQKCQAAVMEVSSHALDQGRVASIDFDVAIFTNLTRDHLDYHQTMVHYCDAKSRLFQQLGQLSSSTKTSKKWAIINQDSEWSAQIIEKCHTSYLTYGLDRPADLMASQMQLTQYGTSVQIAYQGELVECQWPLVGRFNVYNCLAAMATLLTQGIDLKKIAEKMSQLPPVRGRLEPVPNALNLKIYVDFAHSDDALKNVLETLRELQMEGRLIVVFGCGGDRDRTKRPKMAEVCELLADFTFVTSDNPRSENPLSICEEIIQGFSIHANYTIEIDRSQAIYQAIAMATAKDVILIAGKGHESYQIFATHTISFDDCQVAANYCNEIALLSPLTHQ
jgi:UDP-N-acetylmuramoyl-L-alanyl-D-glutamate--2,6-diaminopimelate ligase